MLGVLAFGTGPDAIDDGSEGCMAGTGLGPCPRSLGEGSTNVAIQNLDIEMKTMHRMRWR